MRISDWSSDVCSSDLFIEKQIIGSANTGAPDNAMRTEGYVMLRGNVKCFKPVTQAGHSPIHLVIIGLKLQFRPAREMMRPSGLHIMAGIAADTKRSEEHTSELQSLMRSSYAVFCLKQQ